MKKALIFMLALLLIATMAACATPDVPEPEETQKPEELPDVYGEYGVSLPTGVLPDSTYAAAEPPARYYDNTTLELIPSADYGRIWPYIGGWAGVAVSMASELIGICDENGRVICDPVYNDVAIIESAEGQKLYLFTKLDLIIGEAYEERYIATLAALDGSFADTYDELRWREFDPNELGPEPNDVHYWRDAVQYNYITVRRGEKWGVVDWDGTLLLPLEYNEPVCFSEGLASIVSDDGKTVSFIDISGNVVLGPYNAPPLQVFNTDSERFEYPITDKLMFIEGYARIYANGKFGMIDKAGRIVVPVQYDFITSFSYGIARVMLIETTGGETRKLYGLIDHEGDVILEPDEELIKNTRKDDDLWPAGFARYFDNGMYAQQVEAERGVYRWALYNLTDGGRVLPGEYHTVIPIDGRFLIRGDNFAGLIDADGSYIIKVPVTAYAAD